MTRHLAWITGAAVALSACGPAQSSDVPDAGTLDTVWPRENFATRVVSFTPGPHAGFGQDLLPDVVLGAPRGEGDQAGSLDVLSLGTGGEIVLAFERDVVDGEGPDLIVFENAFGGWIETAFVAVSADGETWHEFPCLEDRAGCAGVNPVFASPTNVTDPTDPSAAGGDAFDLKDLGVTRASFVRVRDSGRNPSLGNSAGFDLDAVSVVHGAARE